jgi:hypothetical protein
MVVCCGWYEQHGLVPILPWYLAVPGFWGSVFVQMVLLDFWSPWPQIVKGLPQLITESGSAKMLGLGRVPARKLEVLCLDIPPQIPPFRHSVNQAQHSSDFGLPLLLSRVAPCPNQGGGT